MPVSKAKNSAVGKTWERTNGADGHRPLFRVECRFCAAEMVLRHSHLGLEDGPYASTGNTTNLICYKCPGCDSIQRFDVHDDAEYLEQVKAHRGGSLLFVPDMEDWERDEQIKKQLYSLGYF